MQIFDDIFSIKQLLYHSQTEGPSWKLSGALHKVIAYVYPAGAHIAYSIFLQNLSWRHPDLPYRKWIMELFDINLRLISHYSQGNVCQYGSNFEKKTVSPSFWFLVSGKIIIHKSENRNLWHQAICAEFNLTISGWGATAWFSVFHMP